MLAQLNASPVEVAGWLGCLFVLTAGFGQLIKLYDRLKGKPPTEQLEMSGNALAERVEDIERALKETAAEADQRRRAIYSEIGKLRDDIRKDLQSFEVSLRAISNDVAALDKAGDISEQRLAMMDAKIDRLLERKH